MLAENLKIVLASSYTFVIKVQNFHWNVEGPRFNSLHNFFGDMYDEVYDNSIDKTAEYIRTLDTFTPGSLTRFSELSIIQDQLKIPRAELMVAEIYEDNLKMIEMLKQVFTIANDANEQGIADFIATRIDAHGKHGWMLRSLMKHDRA
jgi:starvation-inducible DNA-binding protein